MYYTVYIILHACVPDYTQDRFATGRSLPPVDAMQDWILEAGEQENGFTILAFRRNLVTCDEQFDKDIQVQRLFLICYYRVHFYGINRHCCFVVFV